MAQFGLGNFVYEIEVKDSAANFHFFDPEDASNTADVSVGSKDFPGDAPATSREVADLAFAQCSKVLNDKRDARLRKEADAATADKLKEDARVREAGEDFHNNANDVVVEPTQVDEDGTKVYNTANVEPDVTPDPGAKGKKK